jgi:hypothetical protein
MSVKESTSEQPATRSAAQPKRPYVAPELSRLGAIADVTQANMTGMATDVVTLSTG